MVTDIVKIGQVAEAGQRSKKWGSKRPHPKKVIFFAKKEVGRLLKIKINFRTCILAENVGFVDISTQLFQYFLRQPWVYSMTTYIQTEIFKPII